MIRVINVTVAVAPTSLFTAAIALGSLLAAPALSYAHSEGNSVPGSQPPAAAAPASAESSPPEPDLRPLQNTGVGFLALETVGSIAIFATYSLAAGDPPDSCRWCNPTRFDEWLRDALVMDEGARKSAATVSHVLSAGVIPVASFTALLVPALSEGRGNYAAQDAWIMINTFLLTTGITDGTKKFVGRQRPAFYYGEENHTEYADNAVERNLSFFSGDTAWAFSFAASASTLAFLRGNRLAPLIAGGGGALALGTGFLRVAADAHWTTDMATGALVGTGLGIAVPLLLHRPAERGLPALRLVPWVGRAKGIEIAVTL